jgi:hypothetical protein
MKIYIKNHYTNINHFYGVCENSEELIILISRIFANYTVNKNPKPLLLFQIYSHDKFCFLSELQYPLLDNDINNINKILYYLNLLNYEEIYICYEIGL